jgi:two-component system, LuxR family, sensor kinase FixL
MGRKQEPDDRSHELAVLEHAVDSASDAFVTIDQDHRVLVFNKAAEKVFGYGREEVLGHDLDVIMAPTCSRSHREAVGRYVRTRVPTRIGHATELMAARKNGEVFPASISFSVTEVGGRLYFTGIVRDMTEARALQERMVHSERLVALGQLVAEITHEIKNPLMMIGGFARQLLRTQKDKRALKKLSIISSEVERLEKLLKDLREVYLPINPIFEAFDLRDLLREIHDMVDEACRRKEILFDLSMEEKPLLISGNSDRLKQVFLNLVKNAMEAMEKGGKISVEARARDGIVETTVSDQGPGISTENIERIFAPFFTTKSYGTGLGLCVSKRILEEHEGSAISVESVVGKGTLFRVNLPLLPGSSFVRNPRNE